MINERNNIGMNITSVQRRRLMDGAWLVESEEERKLQSLAEQYCTRCEAYDQGVCTGKHPKTGEAMPATSDEQWAVNTHAHTVHEEIVQQAHVMGFTEEQVVQAIRDKYKV
jgi:hypothetical protein